MEQYFTAVTYKGWERIGEPIQKDGKLYTKIKAKCDRCTKGIYAVGVENGHIKPHPMFNGVCLKCNGAGFLADTVRLYTEKEFNAMERAKERAAEKKEEAKRAGAAHTREQWLITNGFNTTEEITYVYIGTDSYQRKDELKAAGWKYHPLIGWHNGELNIPYEGTQIYMLEADEAVEFNMYGNGVWKSSAKDFIEAAKAENKPESVSEWIGLEKDKIFDVPVVLEKISGFQTRFGWSNLYRFKNGENIINWFTSTNVSAVEGGQYLLSATIKKHDEYKGEKQTVVTRAKLEEVI